MTAILPPWIVLDSLLHNWLLEDIGRGDRTTSALFPANSIQGTAKWIVKEAGVIAGLPIADRTFKLLDSGLQFHPPSTRRETVRKRRSNCRDFRQFRCAANRRKSSIKLGNAFERHRYFNSEIC